MKSTWYTESTIPPLDHVPATPTPRKYVRRGLRRAAIAGISAAAAIGIVLVFPLVLAVVAVGGALWWIKCRFFGR